MKELPVLLTDFPQIARNVTKHVDTLSIWIGQLFGFSPTEQLKFINEQSNKLFGLTGSLLSGAVGSLLIGLLFAFLDLIPYLGASIGNILGAFRSAMIHQQQSQDQ